MPMEMKTRLCHTEEPVNGFQSLVCLGIIIVDPEWGRVRDENIKGTTIVHPVQQQAWKHAERSKVSVRL